MLLVVVAAEEEEAMLSRRGGEVDEVVAARGWSKVMGMMREARLDLRIGEDVRADVVVLMLGLLGLVVVWRSDVLVIDDGSLCFEGVLMAWLLGVAERLGVVVVANMIR